jgi:hypothetical protein
MDTKPLYVLRMYGLCYVIFRALVTLITWLMHGPGAELSKGPAPGLCTITYSNWSDIQHMDDSADGKTIGATILLFFLSGSAHSSRQMVALANSSAIPRDSKDSKDSQNAQ